MRTRACLWVTLLAAASIAPAQEFRLGVDYSEVIPTGSLIDVEQVATGTDAQGNLYVLASTISAAGPVYNLVKLSPGGDHVIYQKQLTFTLENSLSFTPLMAVDAAGNVYLSSGGHNVEKLNTDGQTIAYTADIGQGATLSGLAANASGRACVTGSASKNGIQTTPGALQTAPADATTTGNAFVVCLKPSGAVDYATYIGGSSLAYPSGLAVDDAGSVFVSGLGSAVFPTTPGAYLAASGVSNAYQPAFLARLSEDGSSLIYSTFINALDILSCCLTVDSNDNAAVAFENLPQTLATVERFNAEGTALLFSRSVPAFYATGLATDTRGNTYLEVDTGSNFPVRNSVAQCSAGGNGALMVLDSRGDALQSTYIPVQIAAAGTPAQLTIQVGVGSTVYLVGTPGTSYEPTRTLEGSAGGLLFLAGMSQNATAPVVQLACIANGASFDSAGISGGEIVTLFGEGLGPAQAAQPAVNLETGFPNKLADVQVTFNGTPGPLIYVEDSQINAIAPWSLAGSQAASICVVYKGNTTNCITRPILEDHPGVFTVDGAYAAALNQDGTINTASNPAQVGSIVSVFATGLGAISPAEGDGAIIGLPLPVDALSSSVYWQCTLHSSWFQQIFSIPVTVTYAGPAPYEVAGLSQINFAVQATGNQCGISGSAPSPFFLQSSGAPSSSNGFFVHVAGQP